ncbi:MAG: RsmB/NOP family class I SAM-dependent RNA methyltransferase [Lentisphaeria bacterium]|nr:RsmB/NOP family class I SAM-dependent RNA methyltransferase [Lentisphaeria bacterium]
MKKDDVRGAISELKLRSQLKLAENALHTVFCAVFREGRAADRVLSAFFRDNHRCGSRDRRFISEAVFGVLRCWGMLRRGIDPDRRLALENGTAAPTARELTAWIGAAVQIDRLELPAARLFEPVSGADRMTRAERVLRQWGVTEPVCRPEDMMPEWVADMVEPDFPLTQYGESLGKRAPMWIRLQGVEAEQSWAKIVESGLPFRRHPLVRRAAMLENSHINLYTLPAFREGLFEVQDLASQMIGLVCAPKPGERWLDLCAGAGGKTLQLADLMGRRGSVVASDVREYKLEDLRKRARRAGFPNIRTRAWDGKDFQSSRRAPFDGVLADVPCSCSGVWRRNPDGPWSLRRSGVEEMVEVQRSILESAAAAVRPGGVLVYATCSIFAAENRLNVERFLASHPEFSVEPFTDPLTGGPVESGMLSVKPGTAECDAMFAARLRRRKDEVTA